MPVVLHLFALLLLVALGFYVFVADPRRRAHQTFAAFIGFLAIWTVKDLIFWDFYPQNAAADWWATASFITALLMQYAMVVFAWVFPENARTPRRKAAILFAPGVVLIPASVLGLLWRDAGFVDGRFSIDLKPLAYFFVAYIYFIFWYGSIVLFQKYRKYQGTQKGQQLGAILWGLAITVALKTIVNIALPYFGRYELLPFSSMFFLPGVLIFAYAMQNFRLFSFQSALNQFRLFPLTYKVALSIASVACVSFMLLQVPIAWWAFRHGMDYEAWRRYLVFSIISALIPNLLLLLLVLRTISRPLQRITLAAVEVSKGSYGTEVDLRQSNDEIGLLAESFNKMSRKMASDISELQRLNQQLIRADKLASLGTLSAGVAHEVNNPLASMSSIVQILRSQDGHSTQTREKLKLISDQISRITQVTQDLTSFARIRSSIKTETDINSIIRKAIRLSRFDKTFQGLDVTLELCNDLPLILADEDQLQQVFLNLFLNAKDAMPRGGTLVARTSIGADTIVIEVGDTGVGVDESEVKLIFDPFYTTKSAGKGTGLGLAVCYGIISAHEGRIEVRPNLPSGTVFTISLPV